MKKLTISIEEEPDNGVKISYNGGDFTTIETVGMLEQLKYKLLDDLKYQVEQDEVEESK